MFQYPAGRLLLPPPRVPPAPRGGAHGPPPPPVAHARARDAKQRVRAGVAGIGQWEVDHEANLVDHAKMEDIRRPTRSVAAGDLPPSPPSQKGPSVCLECCEDLQ